MSRSPQAVPQSSQFRAFPQESICHWETRRRVVWNEQEHTREEHELVYEISWIKELGSVAPLSTVAAQGDKLKSSSLPQNSWCAATDSKPCKYGYWAIR